jgi:hypothetical protein
MSDEKKGGALTGEELGELARLEKMLAFAERDGTGSISDDELRDGLRALAPALLESARLARIAAELFEEHGEHLLAAAVFTSAGIEEAMPGHVAASKALESTIAAFRKGAE